jgi:uncharacterized membrane protein YcjF (UPF0283 family)
VSNPTIALLITLWFAILIVGVTFTLINTIRFVQVRHAAREADADEEAMLLAQSHLSGEMNRLIIMGFFLLMGFAVVIRQRFWIGHEAFTIIFDGALESGALFLTVKAIMVWRDVRHLHRIEAKQQKEKQS